MDRYKKLFCYAIKNNNKETLSLMKEFEKEQWIDDTIEVLKYAIEKQLVKYDPIKNEVYIDYENN